MEFDAVLRELQGRQVPLYGTPCTDLPGSNVERYPRLARDKGALKMRTERTLFHENTPRIEGDTRGASTPVCSPKEGLPNSEGAPAAAGARD